MIQKIKNQNAQILASILVFLFLVYFAATIFLFFLHKEGLFRFEFGRDLSVEEELVFDKNRVLELFRREKLVQKQFEEIDKKREEISRLKKQLEVEKEVVSKDRKLITETMAEIEEKLKGFTEEEEKNLKRLSALYSKMKANRVAVIFKELDVETIAELLIRMQDKVSAKILGEVGLQDAKRAALISDLIQGKKKKAPFSNIT